MGLEWHVKPGDSLRGSEALIYCASLDIEGTGWRRPDMDELYALYDKRETSPDGNGFDQVSNQPYWSSRIQYKQEGAYWSQLYLLNFRDGSTFHLRTDIEGAGVLCVRGSWKGIEPPPKGVLRADGREWQNEWSHPMTWWDAERYCLQLDLAGGGWRLPSAYQLKSLQMWAYGDTEQGIGQLWASDTFFNGYHALRGAEVPWEKFFVKCMRNITIGGEPQNRNGAHRLTPEMEQSLLDSEAKERILEAHRLILGDYLQKAEKMLSAVTDMFESTDPKKKNQEVGETQIEPRLKPAKIYRCQVYREMGLLSEGRTTCKDCPFPDSAAEFYRKYLQCAPDADDGELVRFKLQSRAASVAPAAEASSTP